MIVNQQLLDVPEGQEAKEAKEDVFPLDFGSCYVLVESTKGNVEPLILVSVVMSDRSIS